ncbi:uncharacterized protein LOC120709414 [Panicum virgatum]|uniref:Uncharacterized protein n=1 Tax=Panicum virgatum TaxID=38727 RepID=A0A8T0XES7_PANVG|nr:uncharacterized protein LOC120709414 [Panicum virgatum]KAG2659982.1 hypothetical protein PVAP13_1KG389600 [Panicum virgatum]
MRGPPTSRQCRRLSRRRRGRSRQRGRGGDDPPTRSTKNRTNFFSGRKNCILARDLKFPECEFELRHDSFGIAYQLHGDHLCKVWERFLLIWSSFRHFSLYHVVLFLLPPLFVARCSCQIRQSKAVAGASRTGIQRGSVAATIPSPTFTIFWPAAAAKPFGCKPKHLRLQSKDQTCTRSAAAVLPNRDMYGKIISLS